MSKIKVNDFVVAIKQIEDIEEGSVGFVESVSDKNITIFFIGKRKLGSAGIARIGVKLYGKGL